MHKLWLYFLLPLGLLAQGPSCVWDRDPQITSATTGTVHPNNTGNPQCNAFALTWVSTGFSGVTIQLEGADASGGSYTAFTASSPFANPATSLSGAIVVQAVSSIQFIRANVTSVTGSGQIRYQIYGYNGVTPIAGAGGGAAGSCGALGGDVTGTCAANTVVAIRNHAVTGVQGNGAKAQLSTGATTTSDCVIFDANGNTIDSGSPTCGGLTSAITSLFGNTGPTITSLNVPTGDSLQPTGTGTITATQVPTAAGATATVNGKIIYDTTLDNLHAAKAGADAIVAQTTAANAGNGNCVNWINSGGTIKIGDAGAPCGTSSGTGGGVLTYSGPSLSVLSGTSFCPVGGGGACSATETNVDIDSAAVSTVSNLYVQLSQALGLGNSVVITWRKNASSQTVTCTISGAAATACNDTTHSFAVAQADLLDYQLVFSGTIVVTPTIMIMSQFGSVNAGTTSVTGVAPITSTGGTTPAIGCVTCLTGAPTNHGVALGGATQATTYTAGGTAGQLFTSGGPSADGSYKDFPDVKVIPAANCNNATAGNGWSIGSGGTVTCRAGTNNLGGFIAITDTISTFAQFTTAIPEDWDSGTNPYIRFQIASTDATNGHTIIPAIQVSCAKGDGTTTDDVTFNASHSLSTVTLNTTANQFWSTSNVQLNSTDMTGCAAGSLMIVQVGRATDTATNARFYSATITFPRALVIQAN